ncbi:unnamed protein product [Rotaria sp. Silwood2]|nr:unnamed protein product [Rotaria sp. Silwood2]
MEVDTPSNTKDQSTKSSNNAEQEEEEEFLIMADIGHDIDQHTVLEHAVKSEIRAIDIDGINPFIQIGPYTFQGQYNYILGTNLFFSTTSTSIDDNVSTSSRTDEATLNNPNGNDLNLIGISDKKLNLSRVYIYPKKMMILIINQNLDVIYVQ